MLGSGIAMWQICCRIVELVRWWCPCSRVLLLPDNEFITESNHAYVKPALLHDKQHYVYSENTEAISARTIVVTR